MKVILSWKNPMRSVHQLLGEPKEMLDWKEQLQSIFWDHKVLAFKGKELDDTDLNILRDVFSFGTDEDCCSKYTVDYSDVFPALEKMGYDNNNPCKYINPWHLENNYMQNPPVFGMWSMDIFDCVGGKTLFIDMGALYEKLPKHLKNYAENTYTVSLPNWFPVDRNDFQTWAHSGVNFAPFHYPFRKEVAPGGFPGREYVRVAPHPLVGKHPISKQKILRTITELPPNDPGENREIYLANPLVFDCENEFYVLKSEFTEWLKEELENPDNHLIHNWETGDVLVIDLFSLAHAVTWFDKEIPPPRVMQGRIWFEPGVKKVTDDPLDLEWVWEVGW